MIRVALVGCGAVARHAHVPAWLSREEVRLVAVCDPNADAAEEIKRRYRLDCSIYSNLEDMLAATEPDVLDVCTPGYLHYEHALAGLKANANVLVEKPPAMSLAEAEELITRAKEVNRKLGAIFNFRYYDLMVEAKRAISDGLVGEVTKVHVLHHAKNVYGESPFLWDEKKSKYLLYEFGIHFLDAMVYLAGPVEEILYVLPTRSKYTGETTDLCTVFKFASGALGYFEITADFTRHSSSVTYLHVYGTAMDLFIRRFPPSLRLAAGLPNPVDILRNECKAIGGIISKILLGKYVSWRNVSHKRVVDLYVDWLLGKGDYPMKLSDCTATLWLLSELEKRIPAYCPSGQNGYNGS